MKESFWEIVVEYSEAGGKRCSFKWERGHLFDHAAAVAFFQPCVMNPTASVLAVGASVACCIPQSHRSGWSLQMRHSTAGSWPQWLLACSLFPSRETFFLYWACSEKWCPSSATMRRALAWLLAVLRRLDIQQRGYPK